jgi:hypothetical protein
MRSEIVRRTRGDELSYGLGVAVEDMHAVDDEGSDLGASTARRGGRDQYPIARGLHRQQHPEPVRRSGRQPRGGPGEQGSTGIRCAGKGERSERARSLNQLGVGERIVDAESRSRLCVQTDTLGGESECTGEGAQVGNGRGNVEEASGLAEGEHGATLRPRCRRIGIRSLRSTAKKNAARFPGPRCHAGAAMANYSRSRSLEDEPCIPSPERLEEPPDEAPIPESLLDPRDDELDEPLDELDEPLDEALRPPDRSCELLRPEFVLPEAPRPSLRSVESPLVLLLVP